MSVSVGVKTGSLGRRSGSLFLYDDVGMRLFLSANEWSDNVFCHNLTEDQIKVDFRATRLLRINEALRNYTIE